MSTNYYPTDPVWRFAGFATDRLLRHSRGYARRRTPAPAVSRTQDVVVESVHQVADAVVSLQLRGRRPLASWAPGSHIDLHLPSSRLRQYSLCGDPHDDSRYRIAVRLISPGGGGSREVHSLSAGAALRVSQPRNAFPFISLPKYFFIAGGIGITPILPMLRSATAHGSDWTLVYTGRTRASLAFLDEIDTLVSDPRHQRVHIIADDETGHLPDVDQILAWAPAHAPLYCCGPAPLLAALRSRVPSPVVPGLHYEHFSPPAVAGGAEFTVELARSAQTVTVPAQQSALAAIRDVQPDVAYSCQQGFCGTCRVRVLAGEVEHRDHLLSPAQREQHMLLCVSRAKGRILIDL